jgi:hypothetical protein
MHEQEEDALSGTLGLREAARAIAEASAIRQGLPPRISDPAVIERLARLARHLNDD